MLTTLIDPRHARAAYAAAARLVGPRCATFACGHAPEWTGQLQLWGAERAHGPMALLSLPRVCSPCSLAHIHQYATGDAFFALVADFARAARLPPPSRESLEAEFSSI